MSSFNFRSNNKNNQNRSDENPFFYRNEQGFDRGYSGNDGQSHFFSDNFYHNQDPYFSGRNFSPRDLPTVGHMQQFSHLRNYQNKPSDQQTFWVDEFSGSNNQIPKEETPSLLKLIIASTGLVVAVAVSWFIYKWVKEPTDTTPMLIKADQGAYKIRPDDPGGVNIPHQDKLIYGRLNKGNYYQEEGEVERLLPPQEEPEEEFLQNDNRVEHNDNYQIYSQENQSLDSDEYYPENYNENLSRSETYDKNINQNVISDSNGNYQKPHKNIHRATVTRNNANDDLKNGQSSGYVMSPPQYENQNYHLAQSEVYEKNNFRNNKIRNYDENSENPSADELKNQKLNENDSGIDKDIEMPKKNIEPLANSYNQKKPDDVIKQDESNLLNTEKKSLPKKSDKEKNNNLSSKNEYYIQLGTLNTENDAVDEWNRLSKKHGLSNYRAVIKVTELSNGKKNYRLLMGPFSDKGKTSKHASKIGGGAKVIQIESK